MPLGDVGIFGRDLEGAEVAVFIERPFQGARWRGDNESTRAESEVDKLHDPRAAFE